MDSTQKNKIAERLSNLAYGQPLSEAPVEEPKAPKCSRCHKDPAAKGQRLCADCLADINDPGSEKDLPSWLQPESKHSRSNLAEGKLTLPIRWLDELQNHVLAVRDGHASDAEKALSKDLWKMIVKAGLTANLSGGQYSSMVSAISSAMLSLNKENARLVLAEIDALQKWMRTMDRTMDEAKESEEFGDLGSRCCMFHSTGGSEKQSCSGRKATDADIKKAVDDDKDESTVKEDLSVPQKHQLKIAKQTLRMNDVFARVMGGMSKDEARAFLRSIGWTDARIASLESGQMKESKLSEAWTADSVDKMVQGPYHGTSLPGGGYLRITSKGGQYPTYKVSISGTEGKDVEFTRPTAKAAAMELNSILGLKESREHSVVEDHELHFAGYDFTSGPGGTKIKRTPVDTSKKGDYGADPLPNGKFKMVPSGDVVDGDEKERRLRKKESTVSEGFKVCPKCKAEYGRPRNVCRQCGYTNFDESTVSEGFEVGDKVSVELDYMRRNFGVGFSPKGTIARINAYDGRVMKVDWTTDKKDAFSQEILKNLDPDDKYLIKEATIKQGVQASLDTFNQLLVHKLTAYDRKQSSKPGYNHYALSHYMGAVQAIESACKSAGIWDKTTPEAYRKYIEIVKSHLGLPLVDRLEKEILAYISNPSANFKLEAAGTSEWDSVAKALLRGHLPSNVLTKFSNGKWGFVGSVDARLKYVKKDGSGDFDPEKNPEDMETYKKMRSFGAGLFSKTHGTRVWDSPEAATDSAVKLGVEVGIHPATIADLKSIGRTPEQVKALAKKVGISESTVIEALPLDSDANRKNLLKVFKMVGADALGKQFLDEPLQRPAIAFAMGAIANNKLGPAQGSKVTELLMRFSDSPMSDDAVTKGLQFARLFGCKQAPDGKAE